MAIDHFEIARLAARQGGVVHLDQLVMLGMPPRSAQRRAHNGEYQRVRHKVYAIGHVPDMDRARWSTAVLAAGDGAVLSHVAAARLWRILPWEPDRIDVSRPTRTRAVPGVVFHETAVGADEVDVVCGIPVTSVARTIADCAQVLTVDRLVRVMREAKHLGLFDAGAIEGYCDPRPRRHGAPRLRAALERHGGRHAGFRSRLEQEIRNVLVTRGAPEPVLNAPYPTDEGDVEGDLTWPDLGICVEGDGPTHDDAERRADDQRRRSALRRAGWQVFPIHWEAFGLSPWEATDAAMHAIEQAMLERSHSNDPMRR